MSVGQRSPARRYNRRVRLFFGFLVWGCALTLGAALFNVLLLANVFLWRRRLAPALAAGIVAAGFGAAVAYLFWSAEWFDVYRHGMPPLGYFLRTMVALPLAVAVVGWTIGRSISRRAGRSAG